MNRINSKGKQWSKRPNGNKRKGGKRGKGIKLLSPSAGLSFTNDLIVLPPEQRVRQSTCMGGYIPASTITAGVTGVGSVFGNTAFQPFESTPKFGTATSFMTEVNGGDTNTLAGYSSFTSMYNSCRTLKSRIRVSCVPSTAGDQVILCVFAASAADITALSLPCSYTYARAQLGFREAFCYVGNRLQENTVEVEMESHRVLGLTKAQYLDQPPTVTITSAPPASTLDWRWVVQYFTADGLLNSNTLAFRIEVAYDNLYSVPVPLTH